MNIDGKMFHVPNPHHAMKPFTDTNTDGPRPEYDVFTIFTGHYCKMEFFYREILLKNTFTSHFFGYNGPMNSTVTTHFSVVSETPIKLINFKLIYYYSGWWVFLVFWPGHLCKKGGPKNQNTS